jgi:two-component system, response regulator PdtaR
VIAKPAELFSVNVTQDAGRFSISPVLVYSRDDAMPSDKRPNTPERILVVEDDYFVSIQIETALIEAGFDVVGIATTADEAIEMATLHKPALVVMDIRLAGKRDGIEAAIDLFRMQGIRSIFATAHDDRQTRSSAQAAMPLGWLPKPYTMASLIEIVRGALDELQRRQN